MPRGKGTIRGKFLALSLLVSVVPLLLLGGFSFYTSYSNMIKSSEQREHSSLFIISENMKSAFRSIEVVMRTVLSDEAITQSVLNIKDASGKDSVLDAATRLRIKSRLYMITDSTAMPISLYLFGMDGALLSASSNWQAVSTMFGEAGTVRESDWFSHAIDKNGYEAYYLSDKVSHKGNEECSVIKLLRDLVTGEPYAMLVANMRYATYNDLLPDSIRSSEMSFFLYDGKTGDMRVIDGELTQSARDAVLSYVNRGAENGAKRGLIGNTDGRSGFQIVAILDTNSLVRDNASIIAAAFIMTVVLIAIAIVCSLICALSITRPLSRLGSVIGKMEKGEDFEDESFDSGEVGQIGNAFLKMARTNRGLQERLVKLSVMEKEAELRALQFQINPHFLYNTLSCIYWLAKLGKNDEAARVSVLLSDNFKYVIGNEADLVTVEAEMTHIRHYIEIQNIRYNQSIHFTDEVDPALNSKKMLKFILQPIVENAICHGLEPKEGYRSLYIGGASEKDTIVFVVKDNGVGVEDIKSVRNGYGTRNVMQRIRLKYGDSYGCEFESELGAGTTVTIRIPDTRE